MINDMPTMKARWLRHHRKRLERYRLQITKAEPDTRPPIRAAIEFPCIALLVT
jgi:hypothetical protein